jgi:protein arginine kinase
MKFSALLRNTPQWMQQDGPHRDIVLTSRIRFARNLEIHPFPGWATKEARMMVLAELQPKVEALPEMTDGFSEDLVNLDQMKKQVLVEKHLVSREHAAKSAGCAVVINREQTLSIMINEEDHLRMQSIRAGLNLRTAYEALDRVDSDLEELVGYAYNERLGYLTACPTNLGTGMRASAMLHLPGLVMSEQMNQVIQAVNKIGLAVRGLHGEGTEALANLFQISNQHTLGEKEVDLLAKLERVVEQVINHERNARKKLVEESTAKVADAVGRGFAILRYAHIVESKEAFTHLSMVRMGVDLGFVPKEFAALIDAVLVEIQPAHLQLTSQMKLSPGERDVLRAQYIRDKLRDMPEPLVP